MGVLDVGMSYIIIFIAYMERQVKDKITDLQ